MIYFVQCATADGPIKVGFSSMVERRIANLQIGCPYELNLIGVIHGTKESEQVLHRRFQGNLIRGEWYRPHPDLIDFIKQFARGPELEKLKQHLRWDEAITAVMGAAAVPSTQESADLVTWKKKAMKRKVGRAVPFNSDHIRPALKIVILDALKNATSRQDIARIFDTAIVGLTD